MRHGGNQFTKSYKTYQSNYHRSLAHNRYSHVSKTPVYLTKNSKFGPNRNDEDRMISDWPDGKLFFKEDSYREKFPKGSNWKESDGSNHDVEIIGMYIKKYNKYIKKIERLEEE